MSEILYIAAGWIVIAGIIIGILFIISELGREEDE